MTAVSKWPEGSGISVEAVSVVYRNGNMAMRDASFSVPLGSITALVGMNGSGKSTLFKAIMGFVPLTSGSVRIVDGSVREALKNNLMAYVPQNEDIDWDFPVLVEDVVMMGRYGRMNWLRRPRPKDFAAVEAALERVDMTEFRTRQIGELSGGQKKRVFVARALAQDASVILLDEPFTGVDVKTEDALMALLRMLREEGRVMLIATHNLGTVPEFCDRTVLIKGTVVKSGPTADVFTPANLEQIFGGVLRHFVIGQAASGGQDAGAIGVLTDDERPFILYANGGTDASAASDKE